MESETLISLFLGGDVMTGRGIDQILRHPGDPVLYEDWVVDARQYITLAEQKHGTIPRGAPDAWIWGIGIEELGAIAPDVRIVNLETAITTSDVPWPDKGIHYRMHPGNAGCLTAAGIDCCCLANNHVLDWGDEGLQETLRTLAQRQTGHAGAGRSRQEAQQPWVREIPGKGRVVTFCCGSPSSGIPQRWAADRSTSGVFLIDETDTAAPEELRQLIKPWRTDNTVIVVSIHWGGTCRDRLDRSRSEPGRATAGHVGSPRRSAPSEYPVEHLTGLTAGGH